MNILAPGTATDAIEVGRHPFKILLDLSLGDFIAQMSGFAQLLSDLVKSPKHGSSRSDEQPVDSIPETIENQLSHDRLRLDDGWCCAPSSRVTNSLVSRPGAGSVIAVLMEGAVFEHGVDDVAAAPSQAGDGGVVALSLCPFLLVVGLRGRLVAAGGSRRI